MATKESCNLAVKKKPRNISNWELKLSHVRNNEHPRLLDPPPELFIFPVLQTPMRLTKWAQLKEAPWSSRRRLIGLKSHFKIFFGENLNPKVHDLGVY